jgi:ABC-type multidrug transport system ATPase subunit
MFTGETATPKFSPAYKVLYAPKDEQTEQLARQAAKSMLCSRSQNEDYRWQLKGLNSLTGGGLVPETVLNSTPMGKISTSNQTHSFMEIVSACNYLNQIFNKCILTQTEFEDEFFENLFGDNTMKVSEGEGSSSGDKILDIISGFIETNTEQAIEVLGCIGRINSENEPKLELLDTIVSENPCDPACLGDEGCISHVLDLFLLGFDSEREALDYVYQNPSDVMGLINFENSQTEANESETFRYKLRVNGTDIAPASKPYLQWQSASNDFSFSFWKGYYTFVNIQSSVDKAIASWVNPISNGTTGMNDVLLSPYPTKIFSVVSVEQLAYFGLGVIFVVAFLPSVILQLYSIVFEKQTHLQDFQFIMGLRPWVYWAVHFFVSYVPQIFIAIGVSLIAGNVWKYGALQFSDVGTLIVFFLLWQASLTSFISFVSSFFTKTTVACISGTLLYMLLCLPGIIVTFVHPGGNISWLLVSVFPASLAWVWAQVLLQMENVKIGVKWDTLSTSLYSFDSINVQVLMIIAVADTIFYLLLLCFWKDVIFVWLKNLYLFFVGNTVCEPKRGDTKYDSKSVSVFEEENDEYCQTLETLEMASVQITDLRKVFDKGRTVAVKGLNLDMYEGEVTSLLGSNGAGKTTTISILTGRLSSSGGDARILGRSILKDLSLIRRAMGVCTQHDSLWPLISVKEHMVFFSRVKGLPQREILQDIQNILSRLKLLHQLDTLSANLSGGQRRKLSLALAVLGDPYFILLDEPSTGMDPKSRRDTWQFIKEAKEGRVILLTTHFMDEAEELGDKIAIMSNGKLRCWGTPSYLRNVLAIGYQLRFLCDSVADRDQANDRISEIVNTYVKGAKSQPMAGTELKILIPENERKHFPSMLRAIEASKDKLGIESFGLTCTTMEDIFLQVLQMNDEELLDKRKRRPDLVKRENVYEDKHSRIWHNHIPILLWKRFLNAKRDLFGLATQLLAFMVLMLLGLGLLYKSLQQDIPETQSAVTLSAEEFLHAPPGFIPVAQNSLSGNQEFASLEELYAEDVELTFNATDMDQGNFQTELARNITNQRISCDKAPFQSCSALYYADADADAAGNDSRDSLDYTLFFSQSAFHSPAASLNLFDSYILRKDSNGNKNLTLEVLNQPLPLVGVQRRGNIEAFIQVSNLSFIFIILAVALLASSFATYITYEKRFQANMLQTLSGTSTLTYHLSNYIWSFCYFLVVYGCIVVILYAMPTRSLYFYSANAVLGTLLLFLFFGPASIGLGYLLQRPFHNDMISYGAILSINCLFGLLMFELVLIMVGLSFPVFDKSSVPMLVLSVVEWVFPLNPVYALVRGFFEITWFSFYAQYPITCTNLFQCSVYSPFSAGNSLVTRNLIFLCAESIAFVGLFFALELDVFSLARCSSSSRANKKKSLFPDYIDEDVDDERTRVLGSVKSISNSLQGAVNEASSPGEDLVLVKNLWVVYGERAAIKGLSFGLKEGKCFGLLGMNGAGKTSFFKVLTGANKATQGEVLVKRDGETIDLLNDKIKKNRLVGYCPQSDALLPRLTVLEQLQLYGVIKGLPKDSLPTEITTLLMALGLTKYLNRQTGNLSGGNQRKVSVAIALLGQPALVLLDEPSAGLDPEARRSLWNAITDSTQDKTVVLTSHSMEECEALCDYIALMSLGEFHAFGTIAHLKQRFGKGYCLLLYVKDGKMMDVLNFLETVEWLTIDEVCGCEIRIRIDASIDIAWVFEQVEEVVCTEDIVDYSISPTTLEEVFLGFAGGLLRSNFVCRSQLAASGVVNGLMKERLRELQNQSQKLRQDSIGRSITFCEDLLESPGKLKSNRLSLP